MLDRLTTRRRRRFFSGGWGPRPALERYLEVLGEPPPSQGISVSWSPPYAQDSLWQRDGTYKSPHQYLPTEARRGRLRLVWRHAVPERVCVLFAATNEHGYKSRFRVALRLIEAGIAVAIPENPFYGSRRVPGGGPHTVYESLVMGRASVEEGLALVSVLSDDFAVGVSGYSMGGSIASLVSATSPIPVATAAMGASHSPAPVFTEGALAHYVDWSALGGENARRELAMTLGQASTLRAPAPAHTAGAILALARQDLYVPPHSVIDLHRHWPGSELRWLRGGHASLHLRGRAQARLIRDAFSRL
ncbi:MAG: alpha/beta hydrolase family protein [Acidimicrobiia bacterium]